MGELNFLDLILRDVSFEAAAPFLSTRDDSIKFEKKVEWNISDDNSFIYTLAEFKFLIVDNTDKEIALEAKIAYFTAVANDFEIRNKITRQVSETINDQALPVIASSFLKDLNELLVKADYPQLSISSLKEIILA